MTNSGNSNGSDSSETQHTGKPARRIAIVRALPGLGDFLCAVPAWRALRAALPDAHIVLIGLPGGRGLVERFHNYLDELLPFPGYPGIEERPPRVRQLPTFLQDVHARRFDLALQMHGSGVTSNPFTMLLGARRTAGFYLPGQYCPDPASFFPYPADKPEVMRNLSLLQQLGIPAEETALEFPLEAQDWEAYRALQHQHGLEAGTYVCVHPGARDDRRRWPADQFAAVADRLAASGLRLVLTGTVDEVPLTRAVAREARCPLLDLTGETTLGALALLLQHSRLLICNDTGVSHLADALAVPSVIIFSTTRPQRWAPLNRERHRVVGTGAELPATVEAVLQEAENLLATQPVRAEVAYAA